MSSKTIAEYASKIKEIETQISELNKQLDKNQKKLSEENLSVGQFKKEQEDLLKKIKSAGLFNFREKKSLKEKVKETNKNIGNGEMSLNELKEQNNGLAKQVNDLQNQLEKEKWKEDIRTGKISYEAELENIGNEYTKCYDNLQEFKAKCNLLSEWQKYASYDSSSPQANNLWNESRNRYRGCSPLQAVREHEFTEHPYSPSTVGKLNMMREVLNDDRIDSMIKAFDELKDVWYKLNDVKRRVNGS
jgi:chromosome segregation ATPase